MTFQGVATFLSLVARRRDGNGWRWAPVRNSHAHEGLDQSDLRAIIIESWRLDLDVEIDATDQGALFAFVRRRGATFCISRNGGAYHMSHGKGHVVAEADNIGEVLAALS